MNTSTSEYSSGCESGWTTYFDQLTESTHQFYTNYQKGSHVNGEEEEDEDLSMVSDASSGPGPHFHNYNYSHYHQEKPRSKQQKSKTKEHSLCLDDTATSPIFNFSMGNVPTSHDNTSLELFPSPHFEGESKAKKHLSFLKSSTKGKSGSLLGRKRQ